MHIFLVVFSIDGGGRCASLCMLMSSEIKSLITEQDKLSSSMPKEEMIGYDTSLVLFPSSVADLSSVASDESSLFFDDSRRCSFLSVSWAVPGSCAASGLNCLWFLSCLWRFSEKSAMDINMKSFPQICNVIQSRWLAWLLFNLLLCIFETSSHYVAHSNIISLTKRTLWICQLYAGIKIVCND